MNAANTQRSDNNYKGKYSHRAGGTDDQNTTMTDDLSDYSSSAHDIAQSSRHHKSS